MSHLFHLHSFLIIFVIFVFFLLQTNLTVGLINNTIDDKNDEASFLNQIYDIIKENQDQITNHKYQTVESESDRLQFMVREKH